jgi:hypothetical protein
MATAIQGQKPNLDRYVVIHVATTCDEHGVYVTKDSAEVIELGWILLDAKSCEEVATLVPFYTRQNVLRLYARLLVRVFSSSLSILQSRLFAVCLLNGRRLTETDKQKRA